MLEMRFFLRTVSPAKNINGADYTQVCEFVSPCDEFEDATPCGTHSYCDTSKHLNYLLLSQFGHLQNFTS